jgi:hypothetical protein
MDETERRSGVRRIMIVSAAVFLLSGLWLGKVAAAEKKAETCGNYGTSVHFVATPSEAARQALKEEKLVFVLHVSGLFEDPTLT